MSEIINLETAEKMASGGIVVVIVRWVLAQIGSEARRSRAERDKIDAETGATVATGWREMAAELRHEMADRDRACEQRMRTLQQQIDVLIQGMAARDRIIVALAYHRRLDPETRALLLTIAPAADPDPKEHHA